jgi:SAM-dependent methyltransferase
MEPRVAAPAVDQREAMNAGDYAERNREAWNEVAPIHRKARGVDLRKEVRRDSFNALDDTVRQALERVGVAGRRVAHLCCNNGRELISIMKMGASSGVGFDISDRFIAEAQELATLSGAQCDFVRTNVLEIGRDYDETFDLLVITVGALCWIHDLDELFAVVGRLLCPGGHLVISELHPCTDMMALRSDAEYDADDELRIAFSYFRTEPWIDHDGLDYVGGTTYDGKSSISFPHTLSETISAIAANGLTILEFREYAHDIANSFAHLEKYGKLPLSYSLLARKSLVPGCGDGV